MERMRELIASYSDTATPKSGDMHLAITILHGDHDEIVPVHMGQRLSQECKKLLDTNAAHASGVTSLKGKCVYHEIKHCDHNSIMGTTRGAPLLFKAMLAKL